MRRRLFIMIRRRGLPLGLGSGISDILGIITGITVFSGIIITGILGIAGGIINSAAGAAS